MSTVFRTCLNVKQFMKLKPMEGKISSIHFIFNHKLSNYYLNMCKTDQMFKRILIIKTIYI